MDTFMFLLYYNAIFKYSSLDFSLSFSKVHFKNKPLQIALFQPLYWLIYFIFKSYKKSKYIALSRDNILTYEYFDKTKDPVAKLQGLHSMREKGLEPSRSYNH